MFITLWDCSLDIHNSFEIVILLIIIHLRLFFFGGHNHVEIWNYKQVVEDICIWTYNYNNDIGIKYDTNVIVRSLYDSLSILISQLEAYHVKTFKFSQDI